MADLIMSWKTGKLKLNFVTIFSPSKDKILTLNNKIFSQLKVHWNQVSNINKSNYFTTHSHRRNYNKIRLKLILATVNPILQQFLRRHFLQSSQKIIVRRNLKDANSDNEATLNLFLDQINLFQWILLILQIMDRISTSSDNHQHLCLLIQDKATKSQIKEENGFLNCLGTTTATFAVLLLTKINAKQTSPFHSHSPI